MTKVLVVDDEPAYRKHLLEGLSLRGFDVEVSATERESEEIARRFRPDVLVVDWMLNAGVNGPHVAERLRELDPELRIILMSGYPRELLSYGGIEGVVAFVEKPFRIADIVDAVNACDASVPEAGCEAVA